MNKQFEKYDDFLGLSSDQVHRMIYYPFQRTDDIVQLDPKIEKRIIDKAPIVNEVLFFLNRLHELEPLKATAKGFLSQKFVKELNAQICSEEYIVSIRSEMDSLHLHSLRIVIRDAGWIKYRNRAFSLTQKGQKVVETGLTGLYFIKLFQVYTQRFNWAYKDGYPDINVIQTSFVFSLYMLSVLAKKSIQAEDLGKRFIKAFPMVLNEIEIRQSSKPEETVIYAFSLRFIVRFCEYFGFVEIRREKGKNYRDKLFIKTTDLFNSFFQWFI